MTFLGRGDLVPPHRARHWPRRVALLGVLLVLASAGGYAWLRFHPGSASKALASCPEPSTTPLPLAGSPGSVAIRVLNTTSRNGLAHRTLADLAKRGFKVAGVGNAAPELRDVAVIHYSPGALGAARLVAEHIAGHPRLVEDARAGRAVVVWLGDGFTGLATPAEAAAAHTRDRAVRSPVPGPKPTSSCRTT